LGAQVGYKPSYAQQQTRARRWKGSRLERNDSLRAAVIERLASGWSPEQIAGRLKREQRRKVISYESIYRFIYAQLARSKDYRWRNYLPRGKSKRGCRGRKGGGSPNFIEGRVSVANRPIEASDRTTCGHWEADLMMFAKYGQAILTVHERKSRLLLAIRLTSKAAHGVARHLVNLFGSLPQPLRQTVTFDNGTEFARHLALRSLAIETFFCDPYAPWQKGGIENAIGRMRRFIPRKTDLATLSTSRFRRLVAAYNNTPRKCLDFKTPAEAFSQVLHFECESTSPRARGRHRVMQRRYYLTRATAFSIAGVILRQQSLVGLRAWLKRGTAVSSRRPVFASSSGCGDWWRSSFRRRRTGFRRPSGTARSLRGRPRGC
jgi:IS30 family transposase